MLMRRWIVAAALPIFWVSASHSGDVVADLGLRVAAEPVSETKDWSPDGPIVVRVDSPERLAWLQQAAGNTLLIGVEYEDQALAAMSEATALIGFCSGPLIEAAGRLHWIQIFSAGAERCIADISTGQREFLLTNMQRVNAQPMAEHALGMLLALTRGIAPHIRAQYDGEWDPARVPMSERFELGGKTMLLVGLGGIGTAVGQRAAAFGMRITAVRASGRPGPDFVAEVARPEELLRLAAEADVVVNSAPLTERTDGLFDADFFAAMKSTAFFVNVGRGRSVVTADLVAALQEGRLAGAGLDVTDPEPLPADHALWQMPNVIITPHVSAGSDETLDRVFLVARENLRRYIGGEPMLSVVDVERGY